jgi:hypothetical protein
MIPSNPTFPLLRTCQRIRQVRGLVLHFLSKDTLRVEIIQLCPSASDSLYTPDCTNRLLWTLNLVITLLHQIISQCAGVSISTNGSSYRLTVWKLTSIYISLKISFLPHGERRVSSLEKPTDSFLRKQLFYILKIRIISVHSLRKMRWFWISCSSNCRVLGGEATRRTVRLLHIADTSAKSHAIKHALKLYMKLNGKFSLSESFSGLEIV